MNWLKILGYEDGYKLLAAEEWALVMKEPETNSETLAAEQSADTLATFRQYDRKILGYSPISVTKGHYADDIRKVCEEAVRKNVGTPEQCQYVFDHLGKCNSEWIES